MRGGRSFNSGSNDNKNQQNEGNNIKSAESLHFYHFWPGHRFLIGTLKCNLNCLDCWVRKRILEGSKLSQRSPQLKKLVSEEAIAGIATIYSGLGTLDLDIYKHVRGRNVTHALITLGLSLDSNFTSLLSSTDAVCLHIKGGSKESYAKLTGIPSGFQSALSVAKEVVRRDLHLEVAYTIVPGVNSSADSIKKVVKEIKRIDDRIPLHLLRFSPKSFKEKKMPTRDRMMKKAWRMAKESGLAFVYRDCLFEGPPKNTVVRGDVAIRRTGGKLSVNPTLCKEIPIVGKCRQTP